MDASEHNEAMTEHPDLAERILDAVAAIPPGTVATYGDIASRAGITSARMVGQVLARAREPGLPWHRVIRSNGSLADPVAARQAQLLAEEGIELSSAGRVDMRRYRFSRTH